MRPGPGVSPFNDVWIGTATNGVLAWQKVPLFVLFPVFPGGATEHPFRRRLLPKRMQACTVTPLWFCILTASKQFLSLAVIRHWTRMMQQWRFGLAWMGLEVSLFCFAKCARQCPIIFRCCDAAYWNQINPAFDSKSPSEFYDYFPGLADFAYAVLNDVLFVVGGTYIAGELGDGACLSTVDGVVWSTLGYSIGYNTVGVFTGCGHILTCDCI